LQGWADWAGALVLVAIPYGLLIIAGSSELPDPLQRLLGGSSPAGSAREALAGGLISPERLRSFAGMAFIFVLVIALILLASSMTREKKGQA
jgi:hypothetical protein